MKKVHYRLVFLLIFISVMASSCSGGNQISGTSKKCGCGIHKGFVGY